MVPSIWELQSEGADGRMLIEKLIEGAKAAPSPPRWRPPSPCDTPSKGGQEGTPLLRELGCKTDGACQPDFREQKGGASSAKRGPSSQKLPEHLPCLGDGPVCSPSPELSQRPELEPYLSPGVSLLSGPEVSQRLVSHISHIVQLEVSARGQGQ